MEEAQTAGAGLKPARNGVIKKTGLIILVVVLLGAAGGGIWWWHELKTSIGTDNASVTGAIVDVSPKISGRLEKIYIQERDSVQAGQKIAELDNSQYKIAMEQAKAGLDLAGVNYAKLPDDVKSAQAGVGKARSNLEAARAQVKAAEIALDDAKRILDGNEALYENKAISKDVMESIRNSYIKAQAGLESARANERASEASLQESLAKLNTVNSTGGDYYKAQLQQAQALYNNARLTYDNSFIYAPKSGTVVRIPVQEGENLTSGQTILSIINFEDTWVTANVEEDKFGRLKVGQKVDVRIDTYPGKVFAGKVIAVGGATQSTFDLFSSSNSSGNFTKVTQRLPVKIEVTKENLPLKPGMSAIVKIHTAS